MRRNGVIQVGFGEWERAVNKFEKHLIREVKRIVAETAEMMVSQMKALAPVSEIDGGNLKSSIDVIYAKGGLTAIITVGAHYAIYVEYGTGIHAENGNGRKTPWVYYDEKLKQYVFTRGMEAQPFFHPSLEMAMKHFKNEMNKLG